jgi:hypothetical protein
MSLLSSAEAMEQVKRLLPRVWDVVLATMRLTRELRFSLHSSVHHRPP